MDDGQLLPLTSVVPAPLPHADHLLDGRQPVEHGIIGYEMFLKEYSFIANIHPAIGHNLPRGKRNLAMAGFDADSFCRYHSRCTFQGA